MSDTATGGTINFKHKGETYTIPAALIETQRRWNAAHAECQRLQRAEDPESVAAYDTAAATRMAATKAKAGHPWLTESGTFSHARDAALRAAAG